jgi:hypothetical protein
MALDGVDMGVRQGVKRLASYRWKLKEVPTKQNINPPKGQVTSGRENRP